MNLSKQIVVLAAAALLLTDACLTPAQVATVNADAQAAASIIATLSPVACAIVDTTSPTQAKAICQVVTDVSTGATELVPVVASLAALMQVVTVKPANDVVLQAASAVTAAAALKAKAVAK